MDETLANYLKVLKTPAGAPESGRVDWDKVDLLGDGTSIVVEWDEKRLHVLSKGRMGDWSLQALKAPQGWALGDATPEVGGGTLLAKMRWAGKQIEDVALGATPQTSWTVAANPRRRGMRR